MTDTKWQPDLSDQQGPKFRALATAIRQSVHDGSLPAGARLPAVRDLAWRLGMTPGTVARAYQIAAAEGVVDSHVGRGTYVTDRGQRLALVSPLLLGGQSRARPATGGSVDLRSPQLPDLGQSAAIGAAMQAVAQSSAAEVLDYPPLTGDLACREALLDWFGHDSAGRTTIDDVVLTHGGQSAILLILSSCLTGERPRIICEGLSYPGLRHAARLLRAEVAPVAQDGQGMLPAELDRVARHSGGRIVFLTPSAQNPTAGRMDLERREALIAVARRHNLQIIEDESYTSRPGSLRPADMLPALRSLAPERVWHIASLSKILSAGLRFGAVICPNGRADAARLAAQHSFFGVSRLVTQTMTRLLGNPLSQDIAARVLADFAARAQIARTVLPAAQITTQPSLPFLWLTLPPGWRASRFAQRAADLGVLIRAGDEFAAVSGATQTAANAVRIALSGDIPPETLRQAFQTLRRLHDAPQGEDIVV